MKKGIDKLPDVCYTIVTERGRKTPTNQKGYKMTTILTIIFGMIIAFDVFMVTPFGVIWTLKNKDEGKPCYGMIIVFVTLIPLLVIGSILKLF